MLWLGRKKYPDDGSILSRRRLSSATLKSVYHKTESICRSTARFGGGTPACCDETFAAPTLLTMHQEAPVALEEVIEGFDFGDSYIIADAVMQSLSSSMTASIALGAAASSESRKKSRSPLRESPARSGRSAPGAPSSLGTWRSDVSPASTPTRVGIALGAETFLSPVTRKSSAGSARSDLFGGLAST